MNSDPSTVEPIAAGRESWVDDRLPPPSSFFPSIAYDEILDRLHRLTEAAEEVALLKGAQGAGKTTLLYRIQSDTPEHWLPCRVDANPMLHPDQLLGRLARCVNHQLPEEATAEGVTAAFCKLRLQGILPVVMVDDAEQLPISSLMALLRLHEQRAATHPACALILLARPEIEGTLTTHQLHAMGTARFVRLELPRLAEDETAEYVRHFLRMEGVEQALAFNPRQLAALYSESDGLPGKMNDLVIRHLRDAIVARQDPLGARLLRWLRRIPPATALATAAVALLLLSTLLLQPRTDIPSREGVQPATPSFIRPPGEQLRPEAVSEREERRVQPLALPPVAERLDSEAQSPPPAQVPESTTVPERGETATIAEHPVPELEPEAAEAMKPKPPETPATPKASPPDTVSVATESIAPVAAVQGRSQSAAATPRFEREAWLLKQRPDAYTLQILATGSERALWNFAREHRLTTDVYYFKSQRNGRPWITLLFGIYKDRDTSVTVLNMLPDSLRKAGAWPRSLASVQDEIRKVR